MYLREIQFLSGECNAFDSFHWYCSGKCIFFSPTGVTAWICLYLKLLIAAMKVCITSRSMHVNGRVWTLFTVPNNLIRNTTS